MVLLNYQRSIEHDLYNHGAGSDALGSSPLWLNIVFAVLIVALLLGGLHGVFGPVIRAIVDEIKKIIKK